MRDKCINATSGQSGFLAITDTVSENYVYFNWGKKDDHNKKNYPDPINKEQQKLEQEKYKPWERPWSSTIYKQFNNTGKPIPHYNSAIEGWVRDNTPPTGLPAKGANLMTAQIEMQELKAENRRLKINYTDDTTTQEKPANYAPGTQMLLNTTTPSTKETICNEMLRLTDLFNSL